MVETDFIMTGMQCIRNEKKLIEAALADGLSDLPSFLESIDVDWGTSEVDGATDEEMMVLMRTRIEQLDTALEYFDRMYSQWYQRRY